MLKALEGHLECDVFLRGNVLTLDGEQEDVSVGQEVIRELSDEELSEIVQRAVRESGAGSASDMGKVMKIAMAAVEGRADGKRVSTLVRASLQG